MDGQRMLWQVVIGVAAGLGLGSDLRAAEIPLELSGTPSFVSTPACPLAGRLSFRVSRPCRAEVEVRQAGRRWMLAHHDRVEEQHEVAVLGLRAGLTHELLISLSAADKTIAGAGEGHTATSPGRLSHRSRDARRPRPDGARRDDVQSVALGR